MKTGLVSRYHPLLVTLHWLLAVLVVAMLCAGFLLLAPMPSTDPQKIGILLIHMSVGMSIPALMAVRFIVRMWTRRPADATTGNRPLDRIAPLPPSFASYLTFVAHGYVALLLAGLIALHVVAALYHQFVGKDRLFRRMWFGQRFSGPRSPGSGELTSGPVITSR